MIVFKIIGLLLKTGYWFVRGVFALIGFLFVAFIAILGG